MLQPISPATNIYTRGIFNKVASDYSNNKNDWTKDVFNLEGNRNTIKYQNKHNMGTVVDDYRCSK